MSYRCERAVNLFAAVSAATPFQSTRLLTQKFSPAHLSTHFMVRTKVRQLMLTHYHKAEGIQIMGLLKPANVNWAKLQLARVAVAEADVYVITVCCLPWQEKKALMNLP